VSNCACGHGSWRHYHPDAAGSTKCHDCACGALSSAPLPDSLIEDIEQKARAATPGPWGVRRRAMLGGLDVTLNLHNGSRDIALLDGNPADADDARYLASLSPDVVLSLLSEVRLVARARAERAACKACKGTGWVKHECCCCADTDDDECDIQERCTCGSVL
jgi:hypothetical protein